MQVNDRIKEIRTIKASEILPNPKNWRTHPEEQKNAMMGAFAEIGNIDVLKCVETEKGLMLIDGHLRTDILGDNEIKVAILDLTVDEANKALATFDPIAMSAKADEEKLKSLLDEIEFESNAIDEMLEGLDLTAGFGGGVKDGLTDPDEVPEAPEEPVVKPGELWLLGDHRLLCGDSTKVDDVERLMGGEKAGICFTSPPYSDQRTYTGDGNLSPEYLARFIPTAKEFASVFVVNLGMSRKDGFVNRYWDYYISAAEQAGLGLLSWNIWRLGGGYSIGQLTAMFPIEHEFVFVFGNTPIKLIPTVPNNAAGSTKSATDRSAKGKMSDTKHVPIRAMRELGTVFESPPVQNNADHPAQFPIELPAAYIRSINGGVYDPFLGSGTTMLAAEQLNRKCYGMEISPQYCDVIIKRWEDFTGNKAELAE